MRLTMDQKRAVSGKMAERYRGCRSRKEKAKILDELVELCGYDRHYAAWLLRNYGKRCVVRHPSGEVVKLAVGGRNKRRKAVRPRKYGEAVEAEVVFCWEFFDQMCGKRLVEMIPDILPSLIKHLLVGIPKCMRNYSPSVLPQLIGC